MNMRTGLKILSEGGFLILSRLGFLSIDKPYFVAARINTEAGEDVSF